MSDLPAPWPRSPVSTEGKRALMEEKGREERLRDAGFRVVRITWADLSRPEHLVVRIRGQLAA